MLKTIPHSYHTAFSRYSLPYTLGQTYTLVTIFFPQPFIYSYNYLTKRTKISTCSWMNYMNKQTPYMETPIMFFATLFFSPVGPEFTVFVSYSCSYCGGQSNFFWGGATLAPILKFLILLLWTVTLYFSRCFQAGLFIDKGVKTTNASAADPREYLCLDNTARWAENVFIFYFVILDISMNPSRRFVAWLTPSQFPLRMFVLTVCVSGIKLHCVNTAVYKRTFPDSANNSLWIKLFIALSRRCACPPMVLYCVRAF